MRRETRAEEGGGAVNPRRDRLALFGRAAVVPLGPCGSVPWERSGEAWAAASGTALAVSVMRVEQRVGVSLLFLLRGHAHGMARQAPS